jgi:hypothetical protein
LPSRHQVALAPPLKGAGPSCDVKQSSQCCPAGPAWEQGTLCPTRPSDVKQASQQQSQQPPCGTHSTSWRHTWLAYSIYDTLELRRIAQLAQVGNKGPCASPGQVMSSRHPNSKASSHHVAHKAQAGHTQGLQTKYVTHWK